MLLSLFLGFLFLKLRNINFISAGICMKFSIIIFKHGEVVSKKNLPCGWLNLPLSDFGSAQALELAKKLKHERIGVACCSDVLRSKETLVSVLKYHPHTKVVVDHRLRERHFGNFSDSSKEIFSHFAKKSAHDAKAHYYSEIDGGENLLGVSKRIFPFVNDVLHFMKKERVNVAISAHDESFRLICEFLEGFDSFQTSRLEFDSSGFKKFVVDFS